MGCVAVVIEIIMFVIKFNCLKIFYLVSPIIFKNAFHFPATFLTVMSTILFRKSILVEAK